MKILFLSPIGALGGAERCLIDFLAVLRERRPEWELCLISGTEGALLGEARGLGVQSEVLAMPEELTGAGTSSGLGGMVRAGLAARRYSRLLRARCRDIAPDLVHSNGIKFHLLTRMMGRIDAPIVWHIHDFLSSRRLMRGALRWASRCAALAVANSEATAIDTRKVLPRTPVKTLLNAVDTNRFSPQQSSGLILDELSGLPPPQGPVFRVGLVATYARWKGHDLFLEAAALVRKAALPRPVRFYIVGDPIYKTSGSQFTRDELRARAAALDLQDCVGFVPFQDNPETVYRALDVVVHASTKAEPFGRTIAEAMSCGRPVVAALEGGVPELFENGRDALGVTPRDPAAFSAAIVRLLSDEGLRESMGRNAREAALTRFSLERLGREWVQILSDLTRAARA